MQLPAARLGTEYVDNDPGRRSMYVALVSQTNVETTLVAATSPVLQTRAPTGKLFGPVLTLLLSSPTTFHVSGVIVRIAAACALPWG